MVPYDFKKEWPKLKKQLVSYSQEAVKLAKKGEEKAIQFGKESRLHLDIAALKLRQEQLFYKIGKEFVALKGKSQNSAKLNKLIEELESAGKEEKLIRKKIQRIKAQ